MTPSYKTLGSARDIQPRKTHLATDAFRASREFHITHGNHAFLRLPDSIPEVASRLPKVVRYIHGQHGRTGSQALRTHLLLGHFVLPEFDIGRSNRSRICRRLADVLQTRPRAMSSRLRPQKLSWSVLSTSPPLSLSDCLSHPSFTFSFLFSSLLFSSWKQYEKEMSPLLPQGRGRCGGGRWISNGSYNGCPPHHPCQVATHSMQCVGSSSPGRYSIVCMMPVRRLLHLLCRSCRSLRPSPLSPSSSTSGTRLIRACSSAFSSKCLFPECTSEANQNRSDS